MKIKIYPYVDILYKQQLEEVEEKLDEKLDVWVDSAKKKVCLEINFVLYTILWSYWVINLFNNKSSSLIFCLLKFQVIFET